MRRARIHHLRIPPLGYRLWHAGLFAAASVGGLLLAEFVARPLLRKFPLERVFSEEGRGPIYLCLALGIGCTALAGILLRVRHVAHHRPRNRIKRLDRLAQHRDCAERLPHRLMERAIRRHVERFGPALNLLRALGPRHIILINGPNTDPIHRARALRTPFEPMELVSSEARIDDLFELEEDERGAQTGTPSSSTPKHVSIRQRLSGTLSRVLPILAVILFVAHAIRKMTVDPTWRLIALVTLTGLLVVWLSPRMDLGRRWWIAPGMLITRLALPWRRESIDVLGPETSPLLLDFRRATAVVRRGGRLNKIEGDTQLLCALLVAWVSEAPQPTREQIKSLLADRSEVPAPSAE